MPSVRASTADIYSLVSQTVASGDALAVHGVRTTAAVSTASGLGATPMASIDSLTARGTSPWGMIRGLTDPDTAPGTGSQTYTNTGGTVRGSVGLLLTDVDEASPYGTSNQDQGATGSGTATLTGVTIGHLVVCVVYHLGFAGATFSGTDLLAQAAQDGHAIGAYAQEAAGTTVNISVTVPGSETWVAHMFSVAPASGGPSGGGLLPFAMGYYLRQGLRKINGLWRPVPILVNPMPALARLQQAA